MAACARCGTENPLHARFCLGCGAGLENGAEASPGSRRTVTVLFSDLVGSTMLGERHDPELIRTVLARYFAAMAAVIRAHGGTLEKYIGDAIMAVFGLPRIHEDDALRAVRAAQGMRDALASFNTELSQARGLTLVARTGLATGEVVAGDPASGGTLVTGDVVNTAARIEAAADPGGILLAESTWRLVREVAIVERVDPLAAKGKSRPVPVVRLLGLRDRAPGVPAGVGPGTPLVGRTAELARLDGLLAGVVSGRVVQVVVLTGPAGAGKSRLVAEWITGLGEDVRILHGRCLSYGEGITWWPLRGILHAVAGIVEDDDAAAARRKLLGLVGDVPAGEVIAARLATLLGLSDDPAPVEELHWAVRRVLERLARERPMLLVVEDIHWAERPLLDLLAHLAAHVEGVPLLILCPARPEIHDRVAEWGWESQRISWEPLDALGPGAMEALADAVGGGAELPATLRARAIAVAEGNPLFLEELVRMLVEDGATAGDDIALPPTIGALLAARLDALPAGERGTAQRASVVGRAFEAATVVALTPQPARTGVREAIAGLLRRELVLADADEVASALADAADAYRFRHILIRDAAYEGLTKTERADLHERFADWLEAAAGDRLTEYQAILGHHLARAHAYRTELRESGPATRRLGERAAGHLAAAARAARERGEATVAIELARKALVLPVPDTLARADTLLEAGQALLAGGLAPDAFARAEEALRLTIERGDRGRMARSRLLRMEASIAMGTLIDTDPVAVAEMGQVVRDAEASGDHAVLASAFMGRAILVYMDDRLAEAEADNLTALGHARMAGDIRLTLDIEIAQLVEALVGPTPASEVVMLGRSLLPRADSWPSLHADVLRLLAPAEAMLGDHERAVGHAMTAVRMHRDLAQPAAIAEAEADLAWVHRLGGNLVAAVEALQRSHASTQLAEDPNLGAHVSCRMAQALMALGRMDEASPWIDAAERYPMVTTRSRTVGARARIRALSGDMAAADVVPELLGLVEGSRITQVRIDALIDAAAVLGSLGRVDLARGYAAQALGLAEAKENHAVADQLREMLAALAG